MWSRRNFSRSLSILSLAALGLLGGTSCGGRDHPSIIIITTAHFTYTITSTFTPITCIVSSRDFSTYFCWSASWR